MKQIDQNIKEGILSDTCDYWDMISNYLPSLDKKEKIIIREDSGNFDNYLDIAYYQVVNEETLSVTFEHFKVTETLVKPEGASIVYKVGLNEDGSPIYSYDPTLDVSNREPRKFISLEKKNK